MRGAVRLLALCLLIACDETPTVEIRICSDAVIPPTGVDYVVVDAEVVEVRSDAAAGDEADLDLEVELDTVVVHLRDADYRELSAAGRELESGTDAPARGFALDVDHPIKQGARFVEVAGLLRGKRVISFVRAVQSLEHVPALEMPLRAECYGILCGDGQSCVEGECLLAPGPAGGDDCRGVGP